MPLETKDSSSADDYLPNNKVRGRPPQNDKFEIFCLKPASCINQTKDSLSADHYLPNNKVRGRPPQNDKP